MSTWIFEPGHTAAEFRARHMMVAWVRRLLDDIHGRLELDCDRCLDATFDGERLTRPGSGPVSLNATSTCAAPT
jgi:polyisoprenoid-binding protein YceI